MEPKESIAVPTATSGAWQIEDYLDHLCAPLVGTVPYAERQELRAELKAHLEACVATYQELEITPTEALAAALRQFGDPRRLARQWLRQWLRGRKASHASSVWQAAACALGCFGFAALVGLAELFWIDWLEMGAGVGVPGVVWMFLWATVALLLPIAASLTTGVLAPARQALGTFYALALLILPSAALALYGPCALEGERLTCWTALALMQAVFWLPIGCAAAAFGGWLQTRRTWFGRSWALD